MNWRRVAEGAIRGINLAALVTLAHWAGWAGFAVGVAIMVATYAHSAMIATDER